MMGENKSISESGERPKAEDIIKKVRNIYFRSFLSSCNYSCSYCVFAKSSLNDVKKDINCLDKFCNFIQSTEFLNKVSVFLTPYGEGLIHNHYIEGIARIALSPKTLYVSCQTNLSFNEDNFLEVLKAYNVDFDKVKLWSSFHPEMVSADEFAAKVQKLKKSIDLSVGIVAIPGSIEEVSSLRKALPEDVYMWINAKANEKTRYKKCEIDSLIKIDPLFNNELKKYRIQNDSCNCGTSSIFVNDRGDVYPCHINKEQLFNIYQKGYSKEFKCNRNVCDCYVSYSNRKNSVLYKYFGKYTPVRVSEKLKIQALFLDVDGTITDESGRICESTIESIKYLGNKIPIYLATSLPLHIALKKCVSIKNYIVGGVFANGAYIIDFKRNYQKTIFLDEDTVEALKNIPGIRIYKDGDLYYKAVGFKKYLRNMKDEKVRLTYEKDRVSITSCAASKLHGIKNICILNGYEEDKIMVMGNSLNDLDMIKYFENSVSVINPKNQEIKEYAKYILNIEHLPLFIQ